MREVETLLQRGACGTHEQDLATGSTISFVCLEARLALSSQFFKRITLIRSCRRALLQAPELAFSFAGLCQRDLRKEALNLSSMHSNNSSRPHEVCIGMRTCHSS